MTIPFAFAREPEQAELPDICRNRHGRNEKSEAANVRVQPFKKTTRDHIAEYVMRAGDGGATVREIAQAFGYGDGINKISGRITELKRAGRVFDSGRERDGCSVLTVRP